MWSNLVIKYAEVKKREARCFNWKTSIRWFCKRMRCGVLGCETVVLC